MKKLYLRVCFILKINYFRVGPKFNTCLSPYWICLVDTFELIHFYWPLIYSLDETVSGATDLILVAHCITTLLFFISIWDSLHRPLYKSRLHFDLWISHQVHLSIKGRWAKYIFEISLAQQYWPRFISLWHQKVSIVQRGAVLIHKCSCTWKVVIYYL